MVIPQEWKDCSDPSFEWAMKIVDMLMENLGT